MTPRISVLVSTRNRPEQVVNCVRSILANEDADFELIVVDQSHASQIEQARHAAGADQRLRWVPTATQGLSVSRNVGLSFASAPIIVFTDDDCEVAPNWLASIRKEFEADESLDMIFGAVVLRPEDRASGYAAEFEPIARTEYVGQPPDISEPWGVGANMAFRRKVFELVGHFDELLGAGSGFYAGEETDLTIRAFSRGLKAVFTPDAKVLHLGIRTGAEAAQLLRGYGIGLGAALAKHRRLRTPRAAGLLTLALRHHGFRSVRNLLKGDRHPGFGLAAAILLGAVRSRRFEIDRERGVFSTREK